MVDPRWFMITVLLLQMLMMQSTLEREDNTSIVGNFKPVIVNGVPAKLGEVPYQVSLKMYERGEMFFSFCGGSIIGPQKILTAAHCVADRRIRHSLHLVRVVAGSIQNVDVLPDVETAQTGQWRTVKNVTYPRAYNFPKHDVAILFIFGSWVFNENVKAIRHAKNNDDYTADTCQISGFGKTSKKDGPSDILLLARVRVKPAKVCSRLFRQFSSISNRLICTESTFSDTHKGDSGGPLVCYKTGDPEEIEGLGVLVGVVSGKKGDDTFFQRVSTYYNYIKNNGGSEHTTSAPPSCIFLLLFILSEYLMI